MRISLCMIVKNEEEVLARCLESVKEFADEIVIVDTGSTDNTKEIARAYTPLVYDYAWQDDFASARNFAFSKAGGDYLMWLDADDVLPQDNAEKIPVLKKALEDEMPDMVMCPYATAFTESGLPSMQFERERFMRRAANFVWQGRVHECIAPRGKILHSDFDVYHLGSTKPRGMRNLHIYQKWAGEEKLGARDLFYYGRELYYHRLYTEAVAVLSEMLGGSGWYVNKIEACKILAACFAECGERDKAKSALMQSFLYGEPRAAVCCELAKLSRAEKRLSDAAFWYETALLCRDHTAEGDFEQPACRDYIPLLELTCIYFELGDTARALSRHRKAEELFPESPPVQFNRKFFEGSGLL